MKFPVIILLFLWSITATAQNCPFAKNFINGVNILKDPARKTGLVKWFPVQNVKLTSRENESGGVKKYSPEELTGFKVNYI